MQSKHLMIRLIVLLFFIISCKRVNDSAKKIFKSKSDKIVAKKQEQINYDIIEFGYFDYDDFKDTIKCKFYNDKKTNEPLYNCKVFLKNKVKEIIIPTFSGTVQINNFEKGSIETYEVNRRGDYEESRIYFFNKKEQDWFIKSTTLIENEEEKTIMPKEIWNISMTKKL